MYGDYTVEPDPGYAEWLVGSAAGRYDPWYLQEIKYYLKII